MIDPPSDVEIKEFLIEKAIDMEHQSFDSLNLNSLTPDYKY